MAWPKASSVPSCRPALPAGDYPSGPPLPAGGALFDYHHGPRMDGISLYRARPAPPLPEIAERR